MSEFAPRNVITLHGRLGAAPKLIASGEDTTTAIGLRLAVDDGYYDRCAARWVERPTVWHSVIVFGELAEHTYDSLMTSDDSGKGLLVTVTGSFSNDSYTRESFHPDGEDITIDRLKLRAVDVAVSFRRAAAVVRKARRDTTTAGPGSTSPGNSGTGAGGVGGGGGGGAARGGRVRVAPVSRRAAAG